MRKILWVSRHTATPEQIEELESIFGKVVLIKISQTFQNGGEIKEIMEKEGAAEVVAVLPMQILGELTRIGIQPIRAVMERETPPDGGEPLYTFKYFERVQKVEIVTEPLKKIGG